MRIVIAPDSFKDALPSHEVAAAIALGIKRCQPAWEIVQKPLADGGEGTARVMCINMLGEWKPTHTFDPLMRPISAGYAWLEEERIAVVELAEPSGLQKLTAKERNPMKTTTYGAGIMIRDALQRGAKTIYFALGGSSTHDLGLGFAAALGYRFWAGKQEVFFPSGADIGRITHIDPGNCSELIENCSFVALCDVENVLLGSLGAAAVYAPQKGATPRMIRELENAGAQVVPLLSELAKRPVEELKGAGAAGGCGAGAVAFLQATLESGTQTLIRLAKLEEEIAQSNWLITGEGSLDAQTQSGKLVSGVAGLARKHNVPAIALCGKSQLTPEAMNEMGLSAAFAIGNGIRSKQAALAATGKDLENTAYQLSRILSIRVTQPDQPLPLSFIR